MEVRHSLGEIPTDLHGILAVIVLGSADYWVKEGGLKWAADKKSWNEIYSAFDRSMKKVDTIKITEVLQEQMSRPTGIQEKLPLADARNPYGSQNPLFNYLHISPKKLTLLTCCVFPGGLVPLINDLETKF